MPKPKYMNGVGYLVYKKERKIIIFGKANNLIEVICFLKGIKKEDLPFLFKRMTSYEKGEIPRFEKDDEDSLLYVTKRERIVIEENILNPESELLMQYFLAEEQSQGKGRIKDLEVKLKGVLNELEASKHYQRSSLEKALN